MKRLVIVCALATAALAMPAAAQLTEEELAQAEANFIAADIDESGTLTDEEFKSFVNTGADQKLGNFRMLRRFGAYDRAFSRIDADEDDALAWSEFMTAMEERN